MREVVLLSGDARLEEALRAARMKTVRLVPSALSGYNGGAPAALVVDVRGQHQLPAGVAAFCARHPDVGAVLVASALEPQLMLEAMRAGVNECVSEPVTPQALEEAVRRVLAKGVAEHVGQIFAFVGAKGGVGTTTLAVNTATTLANAARRPVLLLDLHLGHGDTSILLGVEPKFSVIDALENVHRVDETFFRGLVQKTKAGVDLLGSSEHLTARIDPQQMHALLDFASQQYRYTVLDVPRSDVALLDVLETTAAIVLVSDHIEEIAAPVARHLRADVLRANRLEMMNDRATGRLADPVTARLGGEADERVVVGGDRDGVVRRAGQQEEQQGGEAERDAKDRAHGGLQQVAPA